MAANRKRQKQQQSKIDTGYLFMAVTVIATIASLLYGYPAVAVGMIGTWVTLRLLRPPEDVDFRNPPQQGDPEYKKYLQWQSVSAWKKKLLPTGRWAGAAAGWRQNRKGAKNGPELWRGTIADTKTSTFPILFGAVTAGLLPVQEIWMRPVNALAVWSIAMAWTSIWRGQQTDKGLMAGTLEGAGLNPQHFSGSPGTFKELGPVKWPLGQLERLTHGPRAFLDNFDDLNLIKFLYGLIAGAPVGLALWFATGLTQRFETIIEPLRDDNSGFLPMWTENIVTLPLPFWARLGLGIGSALTVAATLWAKDAGKRSQLAFWEKQAEMEEWSERWINAGIPVPDVPIYAGASEIYADDGTPLMAVRKFATQPERDPYKLLALDSKLKSGLQTSLLATYFHAGRSASGMAAAGTRNPMGIEVAWGLTNLGPAPHMRPDLPVDVMKLCLRSAMNEATDSLKIPRPELKKVQPCHKKGSQKVLWKTTWQLYGNATLDKFLKSEEGLRNNLRADWVRIEPSNDVGDLVIYIGHPPRDIQVSNPMTANALEIVEWSYVFRVAQIMNKAGHTPTLRPRELKLPTAESPVAKATFDLPKGITVEDCIGMRERIASIASKAHMEIMAVPRDPTTMQILYADDDPLPKMLPLETVLGAFKKAEWNFLPVGLSVDGMMYWNLKMAPHALYAGSTGSGKSVAMQNVIAIVVHRKWPCWLLDPKRTEFGQWNGYVDVIATGNQECWDRLIMAHREMGRRQKMMEDQGVRFFKDLVDDNGEELAPLFLAVDETFRLLNDDPEFSDDKDIMKERLANKKRAASALFAIAGLGRAMGVHLLCAMQKPVAMSGAISEFRDNLAGRLLLGTPKDSIMKMMFDELAVDMPGEKGRGLWMQTGMEFPREVHCPFIEDLDGFLRSEFDNDEYRRETSISVLDSTRAERAADGGDTWTMPDMPDGDAWYDSGSNDWGDAPDSKPEPFDPKAPVPVIPLETINARSEVVDVAEEIDDESLVFDPSAW